MGFAIGVGIACGVWLEVVIGRTAGGMAGCPAAAAGYPGVFSGFETGPCPADKAMTSSMEFIVVPCEPSWLYGDGNRSVFCTHAIPSIGLNSEIVLIRRVRSVEGGEAFVYDLMDRPILP